MKQNLKRQGIEAKTNFTLESTSRRLPLPSLLLPLLSLDDSVTFLLSLEFSLIFAWMSQWIKKEVEEEGGRWKKERRRVVVTRDPDDERRRRGDKLKKERKNFPFETRILQTKEWMSDWLRISFSLSLYFGCIRWCILSPHFFAWMCRKWAQETRY